MADDLFSRLMTEFDRQFGDLRERAEGLKDEKGKAPPWVHAQADQITAAGKTIADVMMRAVLEHRKEGKTCCKADRYCIGLALMMAIAVSMKEVPTTMVPVFVRLMGEYAVLLEGGSPEVMPGE